MFGLKLYLEVYDMRVIFRTNTEIFKTNQVIFRINSVIFGSSDSKDKTQLFKVPIHSYSGQIQCNFGQKTVYVRQIQ